MNNELEYKITLGYGGIALVGWLTIAIRRFLRWPVYLSEAAKATGDRRKEILDFGGSLPVDGTFALIGALIFGFALFMLLRATWNSWDWATAMVGGSAVFSLVLLCAGGRVMFYLPFTLLPFWLLLYRPGVKRACGVGDTRELRLDEIVTQDLPVNAEREREELNGLYQSLRVYELERGMDTDTFVSRYSKGLEDDSPDNEEWFALARLARRSKERLAGQNGQEPAL